MIIVPNANSIHRQLAVMMGIQETIYEFSPRDYEVGHQRVYDLSKMLSDITSAGFEIIFERGLSLKVLPNGMMTEFPDTLLKALVDISDNMLLNGWQISHSWFVRPNQSKDYSKNCYSMSLYVVDGNYEEKSPSRMDLLSTSNAGEINDAFFSEWIQK